LILQHSRNTLDWKSSKSPRIIESLSNFSQQHVQLFMKNWNKSNSEEVASRSRPTYLVFQ
jgi:hypothetical protein